jgi:hypothetical protein
VDREGKHNAMLAAVSAEDAVAIIMAQVALARIGDVRAAEFVFDRLFGKPTQHTELTGRDGEALLSNVVIYLPDNGRDSDTFPAGPTDAVSEDAG